MPATVAGHRVINWRLPIVVALMLALTACRCEPVERVFWFPDEGKASKNKFARFSFADPGGCQFNGHGIGFYLPKITYDVQLDSSPTSPSIIDFDSLRISRTYGGEKPVELVRGELYIDLNRRSVLMDVYTADGAFAGNGVYEIR